MTTHPAHPACHGPEGHICAKPSGHTCVEAGCDEPAGTPWTPYWCPAHDFERITRIRASLESMVSEMKHRGR